MARRNGSFAATLIERGVNLDKDFYDLSADEQSTIEKTRKEYGYSGQNNLGRSRTRQFYYSAQKGAQLLGKTASEISEMRRSAKAAYRQSRRAQGLAAG